MICGERGVVYRGVKVPQTKWWNIAGHYAFFGLYLLMLCYGIWHLSDLVMTIGMLVVLPLMAVWLAIKLNDGRRIPGTPLNRFLSIFSGPRSY